MDERDTLRKQIKDILKRVPAWINSASVQQVREFKKTHASAVKTAEKSTATKASLQDLKNQLTRLYGFN